MAEPIDINCKKLKSIDCEKDYYDGEFIKKVHSHSLSKRVRFFLYSVVL